MEELQSTDILDREILEDARKKAQRILKTAEDAAAAKSAEWEKKTAEAVDSIFKKYEEQKTQITEKIMARLPVDKLRLKTESIENALNKAVENWYKNTDRKRILELLKNEVSKRLQLCPELKDSPKIDVYFGALEKKETEDLLEPIKGKINLKEIIADCKSPQIILETENARVIASIQNLIDYLLSEKREELTTALVGSAFLEANN